jgi:hypothetical protein
LLYGLEGTSAAKDCQKSLYGSAFSELPGQPAFAILVWEPRASCVTYRHSLVEISCKLMTRVAAVFVFIFAFGSLVAAAQNSPAQPAKPQGESGTPAAQKSKSGSARKPSQPLPDEGTVTEGTYAENFFNLRYVIPPGWVVRTADMRQGLAQGEQAVLLLSASGKAAPATDQVNPSVTISAESLALYPDVKTSDDYFEAFTELVKSKGFSVLNPPAEIDLAGVNFLRGDFQKQQGDVVTYQATMVALRKGYVLEITAISGSEEELTPLLNRLHIFAPPTMRRTP